MNGMICEHCKMDSSTRRWQCKKDNKDMNTFCTDRGTGTRLGAPACYVPPKEIA